MIHLLLQVGVGIKFYVPDLYYIIGYFDWEYSWLFSLFPSESLDPTMKVSTKKTLELGENLSAIFSPQIPHDTIWH
jgi:hypothetical protein